MATATSPQPNGKAPKVPSSFVQKAKYAAIAVLALLLLWLVLSFAGIKAQAQLGVSYASHVACSCRYIEGRPLDSCTKDFEPGMEMVSLTDDPAKKRVTASVPLLASAVAERRGEFGCLQMNDKEVEALD